MTYSFLVEFAVSAKKMKRRCHKHLLFSCQKRLSGIFLKKLSQKKRPLSRGRLRAIFKSQMAKLSVRLYLSIRGSALSPTACFLHQLPSEVARRPSFATEYTE